LNICFLCLLTVTSTEVATMADTDIRCHVQSRPGYRAHLKCLFTTISELMERCNTTDPEEEDVDALTELLTQLERKKAILTDLDTRIMSIINEGEVEAEVLESEDLQLDISSKGKQLQKCRQLLELPSSLIPHSKDKSTQSLPTDTSEPQTTLQASTVETRGTSLPRNISLLEIQTEASDSGLLPIPRVTHAANSTVCLPRLNLPTFSGNALDWQPFWDSFDAAVNSNPTLTGVHKLNYLRSQLQGEA